MYGDVGNGDPEIFRNPTVSGDKGKHESLMFQRPD